MFKTWPGVPWAVCISTIVKHPKKTSNGSQLWVKAWTENIVKFCNGASCKICLTQQ